MSLFRFWGEDTTNDDRQVEKLKGIIELRDDEIKALRHQKETGKHEWDLEKATMENDHKLAIKQKEFEINHLADEKVKTAEGKAIKLEQELAVAKKEIEMLVKITDLNADVIDVKKLVGDLIGKLPEIKLTTLAGSAPAGKKEGQ